MMLKLCWSNILKSNIKNLEILYPKLFKRELILLIDGFISITKLFKGKLKILMIIF
jgi:hypothetical protein